MDKQRYIDQLFNTMWQLRKFIGTQNQESNEEKIATMMQFSALMFLKSNKNSSIGNLAGHLKLSKSSATQLIERMVKMGFIGKVNDKTDRRIIHIAITPTGEQNIIDLKKKVMDKMGKIFQKVPEKDLMELIRIHSNLVEILKAESK